MSIWLIIFAALILFFLAWLRRLRWKPAYAFRLAVLALTLLSAFTPTSQLPNISIPPTRHILVLDQSDSIPSEVRTEALKQAKIWQNTDANRLVILSGTDAQPITGDTWPIINGRATNLTAAFTLATDLLDNNPGQIILATDGLSSDPLAFGAALSHSTIQNSELSIDFIPLETFSPPNDLFVGTLYVPSSMWQGLSFQAVLPIYAPQTGEATLQILQNGASIAEETIAVQGGLNLQSLNLQTFNAEIMTLQVTVSFDDDPRPENNTAYAALRVFPSPRVLIVTENSAIATTLAVSTGLETDLISPAQLSASLTDLDSYQVIILHNFLATSLTDAQMRTLKDFTLQLGRGLIFLGGRNAYTLGGYKDTLLEPILPLQLEPPPRPQNDALTFVLAFDRSSSMGSTRNQPTAPLALAREAALRAIETLGPEDYLGLLAFSDVAGWIIPLGPAPEGKARALDALTQVTPSGGTSIYTALTEAVNGLLDTVTTETRHILLLSDGQSADGTLQDFVTLAQFAHEQGITISTIALGAEADPELMSLIAEAGGGRYYPVLHAADLPKILVDESQAARGDNLVEGFVRAEQGELNHPILSGFRTGLLPSLNGYNALKSKADQGAEDVLVSADFRDPLLSVWQYGLGRVAAWTGDIGEEWNTEWIGWQDWGRFWSQIVLYALPDPSLGPGQVEVEVQPETVHLIAQLQTSGGVPLNGLQVAYTYLDSEENAHTFQMPQTAPGFYELVVSRPPEGVYRGVVSYRSGESTDTRTEIAAPLVINYPIEWQPAFETSAAFQTTRQFQNWTASTGGAITSWETINAPIETPPPSGGDPQQTFSRILLVLLILWPIEIAIRRHWMPWR